MTQPGGGGSASMKVDRQAERGVDPDPGDRVDAGADPAAQEAGSGARATLAQTLKAVGSAAFGVRSSKGHQADIARLNPIHLIIAGVLAAAVFIGVLLLLVRLVLRASGTH